MTHHEKKNVIRVIDGLLAKFEYIVYEDTEKAKKYKKRLDSVIDKLEEDE